MIPCDLENETMQTMQTQKNNKRYKDNQKCAFGDAADVSQHPFADVPFALAQT